MGLRGAADSPTTPPSAAERLRGGSLGLPQVLFQSIALMGPAAGIALSMLVVVALAGPLVPFAFLLAAVTCLLVATCFGQLAKQIPSAGGAYVYVATALGPAAGFVVGWLLVLFLSLLLPLILIALAFVMGGVVAGMPWWIWIVAAAGLVLAINVRDVRLSTSVGIVLGVAEIGIFLALAIWIVFVNASENTLRTFDPAGAPGIGLDGIFKATAIAFVSFVGFESAATLGEEAGRPRWAIPRAVVLAAVAVGLFYVFTSYATVVGFGFADFAAKATAAGNPWIVLGETFWGAGWVLILLALVNSMIGVANAAVTAASRVVFAMARNGVLPRGLARTHPTFRTPYRAIAAVTAVGALVALAAGTAWDLLTAAGTLAVAVAVPALLIYVIVCLSTIAAYRGPYRAEFNLWLHGVIPVAAVLLLLAPLYYQYVPPPPEPIGYANWFALGWVVLGIAVAAWLSTARRDALDRARLVFADDQDPGA